MTETYTSEITVPDLLEYAGYGLLDNVVWLSPDEAGHWQAGVQYDADCPAATVTISTCFPAVTGVAPKEATWEHVTRGARPFTIYDEWDCSPPGRGLNLEALENGRTTALWALAASAQRSAERVFWTGQTLNAPGIVYPNLVTQSQVLDGTNRIVLQPSGALITGGLDVVEGMGQLESAAADCYRGRVWIHVPTVLVAALAAKSLIVEKSGKLYTPAGNRIIIGSGYPATVGPDGAENAAGVTQMWATSPVFGIKGTPRSWNATDSLDRNINTLKFIAEQTYLLGWHCCLIGVTVTIGGEEAGEVAGPAAAA